MNTRALSLLAFVLLLIGCNRASQNKDAVRQGVIEHLSKNAGLDMNQLDVTVTTVQFQGAEARATVSFKPKSSPDQGMTMNYVLERKGDKWVVKGRSDSGGHGGVMGGGGNPQPGQALPPGHPPVEGSGNPQK